MADHNVTRGVLAWLMGRHHEVHLFSSKLVSFGSSRHPKPQVTSIYGVRRPGG